MDRQWPSARICAYFAALHRLIGEYGVSTIAEVLKMIGPVQNTPLPLDPVREQLSSASPLATMPPQPLPAAQQPLPPAATAKDKFAGRDGEQSDDDENARRQQQQQYEAIRELSSAWARLTALQQIARQALGDCNGPQAKEAAIEAAALAASIRDMTDALPGVSVGSLDLPAVFDNARTGLGTAMQVVDLADAIPHHPVEDRQAITGARTQVVAAMAGVEAVAAEMLPTPKRPASDFAGHYDVRA
jgi:hypothetical protein